MTINRREHKRAIIVSNFSCLAPSLGTVLKSYHAALGSTAFVLIKSLAVAIVSCVNARAKQNNNTIMMMIMTILIARRAI